MSRHRRCTCMPGCQCVRQHLWMGMQSSTGVHRAAAHPPVVQHAQAGSHCHCHAAVRAVERHQAHHWHGMIMMVGLLLCLLVRPALIIALSCGLAAFPAHGCWCDMQMCIDVWLCKPAKPWVSGQLGSEC